MGQIVNLFVDSATAIVSWFNSIFESSGMTPFFLGTVTVYFTVRFFIYPFVGHNGIARSRGSDTARSKKETNNE